MSTDKIRQSDRVALRVPVEASWYNSSGQPVAQTVETLLISRGGAVLRLAEQLATGQEVLLQRHMSDTVCKTAHATVVTEIDRDPRGFIYAVAIRDPQPDFWDIDFPTPAQAADALARMLMECSFCRRREIVYLNELELKSFEVRKCVARICKHCNAPSIWTEARSDERSSPEQADSADLFLPAEQVQPSRNRARIKARVLACIRRRGFQEEIAVCEDLSRGGLAFRSRNQYAEGTRLEIAVPFTPGNSAIFVPIRIVSSRLIPAAGLYRHGAAYLK
ncbi:MAG: PilZ domain-containing protein [Acidobacteriia bacterium]|nr:PilZ domain-containing protein [Terriglobia bacterium]